jgi:hypothetical protein
MSWDGKDGKDDMENIKNRPKVAHCPDKKCEHCPGLRENNGACDQPLEKLVEAKFIWCNGDIPDNRIGLGEEFDSIVNEARDIMLGCNGKEIAENIKEDYEGERTLGHLSLHAATIILVRLGDIDITRDKVIDVSIPVLGFIKIYEDGMREISR